MIQSGKKLKISLISTLLVAGLAAGPVRADHDDHKASVLAPLAAFIVLGSLFKHNYGHETYYSRHRHGYSGHRHNRHRHNHRAHSYSSEGYGRKSKRNHRH